MMAALASTTLLTIERAARRSARRLDGAALPTTVGINIQTTDRGALLSVVVGPTIDGADYELDDLAPETIRGAILDALDIATRGPRSWRRL